MKRSSQNNPFWKLKKTLHSMKQSEVKKIKKQKIDIGVHPIHGKYINVDGIIIAIDHWNPKADIIYISHAHMDHIPNISQKELHNLKKGKLDLKFICSKITKEVSELRTRGNFTFPKENWLLGYNFPKKRSIFYKGLKLELLENGHTYGSTSLLIKGSKRILFTSDFTDEEVFLSSNRSSLGCLNPIKCDILITECTYGSPKYNFPHFQQLKENLNSFIKSQLSKKSPLILLAYRFGKSQKILNTVENSKKILLERGIVKITRILEKENIKFNEWEPYGNYNKNQLSKAKNYILIIPPYYIFREPYKALVKNGAKIIYLSGKVLKKSERKKFPADKYLPISDHCDFPHLMQFIRKCDPNKIFLEHGCLNEMSYHLMGVIDSNQIFTLD